MAEIEKIWDSFSNSDKQNCRDKNYHCIEWGIYSAMMKNGCIKYYCGCGQE